MSQDILELIDHQINRLRTARNLLDGTFAGNSTPAEPPVNTTGKKAITAAALLAGVTEPGFENLNKRKKGISAAGRQRISDAMKKRWAAKKKK